MNNLYKINRGEWFRLLQVLLVSSYNIFAPVRKNGGIDYTIVNTESYDDIRYNEAKPVTPLKLFFLPVKLNVIKTEKTSKKTIIIGAPSCDVEGLKLLDLIYLNEKFVDKTYFLKREKTLIITTDCYMVQEHCHCTTYGINPYSEKGCDISLSSTLNNIYLTSWSKKKDVFIKKLISSGQIEATSSNESEVISEQRRRTIKYLDEKNEKLPGTVKTGEKIKEPYYEIWKKYPSNCVSCGACSAICPVCTCFIFIDKPGFEKMKQLDICQYPPFERITGGEDPLKELIMELV